MELAHDGPAERRPRKGCSEPKRTGRPGPPVLLPHLPAICMVAGVLHAAALGWHSAGGQVAPRLPVGLLDLGGVSAGGDSQHGVIVGALLRRGGVPDLLCHPGSRPPPRRPPASAPQRAPAGSPRSGCAAVQWRGGPGQPRLAQHTAAAAQRPGSRPSALQGTLACPCRCKRHDPAVPRRAPNLWDRKGRAAAGRGLTECTRGWTPPLGCTWAQARSRARTSTASCCR